MATVSITEDLESYLASLRSYLDATPRTRRKAESTGSTSGPQRMSASAIRKPVSGEGTGDLKKSKRPDFLQRG
ncbi:hypothetical protein MAP00_006668 [Monascus purpureus]|nr:hypothetical protein MAP00_006668 [Monascus purpureus]